MVKYIYPDHELQTKRERIQAPIIHTNVFTYTQTLMNFHKAHPIPTNSSNKILKIRFQDETMLSKQNLNSDDSVPFYLFSHKKTITVIEIDRPTPAEVIADEDHIDPHTNRKLGRNAPTRRRSVIDERGEIGRGVIGGRGDNDRGGSYGRGGTSVRSCPQYHPTPQSID